MEAKSDNDCWSASAPGTYARTLKYSWLCTVEGPALGLKVCDTKCLLVTFDSLIDSFISVYVRSKFVYFLPQRGSYSRPGAGA